MSYAREVGYVIRSEVASDPKRKSSLQEALGLSSFELDKLFAGRLSLTTSDLRVVASTLGVPLRALAMPDQNAYDKGAVHCMTEFSDRNNREKILDMIDAYIDIREAVSAGKE